MSQRAIKAPHPHSISDYDNLDNSTKQVESGYFDEPRRRSFGALMKQEVQNRLHRHHGEQWDDVADIITQNLREHHLRDLKSKQSRDFVNFDNLLSEATELILSTNLTLIQDKSFEGKVGGYELTTSAGRCMGYVVPDMEPTCTEKICCCYRPGENDPMSYDLFGPEGKELICVYGLDNSTATDDTVFVTQLRNRLVGTIKYTHLGAEYHPTGRRNLSSSSIGYSGTPTSFTVPTSVFDSEGKLLFIFRPPPNGDMTFTEILSVNGGAVVMAQITRQKLPCQPKVTDSLNPSVVQGSSPTGSNPEGSTPLNPHWESTKSFEVITLNFIQDLYQDEKILLFGVLITILNRWLRKRNKRKIRCTIL